MVLHELLGLPEREKHVVSLLRRRRKDDTDVRACA